ncbi:MAG: TonB-dependent receptor plug domain-containing protein [Deltaproteobacteria bacterium]|nr:TonB-dependent receptor plug domain-containing protein [Deltaproteobacteria bacterium]
MKVIRPVFSMVIGIYCLCYSGMSHADDDSSVSLIENPSEMLALGLEDLLNTPVEVWSATRTKSTTDEAPSVITVISHQDIEMWSYRSLADALKHVVGFYVVDDHILPNVGVRGVAGGLLGESGTVKLMIDGRSVAFRATSGNWTGPELIPLTAVERIEIIRGPVSSLYGADAFLAIINVVTRSAANASAEGSHRSDNGEANVYATMASAQNLGGGFDTAISVKKGNTNVLVSARFDREDRSGLRLPDSSPAPSIPSYNTGEIESESLILDSKVALLKIGYDFNEKHNLTLTGYLSVIERGAEFNAWAPLSYGYSDTGQFNYSTVALYNSILAAAYSARFSKKFQLDAKVNYFTGGPRDKDRIEVGSSTYFIRRKFGFDGVDGSIEGRWSYGEKVTLVVGTEMLFDRESLPSTLHVLKSASGDMDTGDVLTESSYRQGTADFINFAAFTQAIFKPLGRYLNLIAGARYDRHNVYGSKLSSRFAAVTNPVSPLYIKVLYGSAYKAPSPLLLHATPYEVGDVVGNDSLKPQFVHSVEGNVSLKWEHFSISTGLAYNLLTDKAEFVQQGVNRIATNLSETESLSWESEIRAGYSEWIKGYLSSEVQLTRRNMGMDGYQAELYGTENVIYPPYIFRGGLIGKIPGMPLHAIIDGMYVGPRRSSDMNSLENFSAYTLEPYIHLNASVAVREVELLDGRNTSFNLSCKNLTNAIGPDPGFTGIDYPLAGRTFLLNVKQEL